ncbi:unnamed protein product [Parascedosporium putredinis]|uniref:MFS general substrate transporter n=1 Tax=Parascedosporium putredinis TaxID=1442378 RepID=A0A9P1MDV5_9PEZI|nr:unnamed protein product [Parascedosporium putredinis]CAI7999328.1 unnamed protein product [Parascedosporium putredinis]
MAGDPEKSRPRAASFTPSVSLSADLKSSSTSTFSIQATVIILPVIGRDLDIPSSRLQWIVSAYALAFGCFLLLWGRIADIYGKRTLFAAGTAWRLRRRRPLGSVFGTLIAGFISEYTSWKWVFGVMAILSGLVAAASIFVIPPPPPSHIPSSLPNDETSPDPTHLPPKPSLASIDWIGAALITTSIFALLFALTQGNVVGWSTPGSPPSSPPPSSSSPPSSPGSGTSRTAPRAPRS